MSDDEKPTRRVMPNIIAYDIQGVSPMQPPGPIFGLFFRKLPFQQFAVEFAKLYPDALLVEPEMITTLEMRGDMSRFYPTFDDDGRVVGGGFQ